MSDSISEIIKVTKRLESLLESNFSASGKGLHSKVSSIEEFLPAPLIAKIRRIATIRNKAVHEEGYRIKNIDDLLQESESLYQELSNLNINTAHSSEFICTVEFKDKQWEPRIHGPSFFKEFWEFALDIIKLAFPVFVIGNLIRFFLLELPFGYEWLFNYWTLAGAVTFASIVAFGEMDDKETRKERKERHAAWVEDPFQSIVYNLYVDRMIEINRDEDDEDTQDRPECIYYKDITQINYQDYELLITVRERGDTSRMFGLTEREIAEYDEYHYLRLPCYYFPDNEREKTIDKVISIISRRFKASDSKKSQVTTEKSTRLAEVECNNTSPKRDSENYTSDWDNDLEFSSGLGDSINPATGLPMSNGVDAMGNPFGMDNSSIGSNDFNSIDNSLDMK